MALMDTRDAESDRTPKLQAGRGRRERRMGNLSAVVKGFEGIMDTVERLVLEQKSDRKRRPNIYI